MTELRRGARKRFSPRGPRPSHPLRRRRDNPVQI